MKPFDLEKAKQGAVVVSPINEATGTYLTELKASNGYVFVFLMTNFEGEQYIERATKDGIIAGQIGELKMEPTKVIRWLNVYPDGTSVGTLFPSEAEAKNRAKSQTAIQAKVEWEE